MGKILVINGADFSAYKVEQIVIGVDEPTISCSVEGVVSITSDYDVYYTIDGTSPSKNSVKYTASFSIPVNTTIKAIAYNSTGNHSSVVSYYYDGTLQAPTISITNKGVVTISSSYTVYYTTNGSTPTASSTMYTSSFTVEDGVVVKAIAIYNSLTSAVSSETAVVTEAPMTYGKMYVKSGTSVTLSDDTSGTWCISPKIPVNAGDSITLTHNGNTNRYNVAYDVEFKSTNAVNDFWQVPNGNNTGTGNRTITAKTGTTYMRLTCQVGFVSKLINNTTGVTWQYDGD